MTASKKTNQPKEKPTPFQRLSLAFFLRPRTTAIIWLFVSIFGILSYSTLLKREGFPAIETPFAISRGTYVVDDASKVDNEVGKPLSDFVMKQSGVKSVQTQSFDNYYSTAISYEEGVNAESRSAEIQKAVEEQKILPEQATNTIQTFKIGYTERGDNLTISVFSKDNTASTEELAQKADEIAAFLKTQNITQAQDISVINPFESATNPLTGATEQSQRSFDRYAHIENTRAEFRKAVVIGMTTKEGTDEIELNKQVEAALANLKNQDQFKDFKAEISGSNAPIIEEQIGELQKALVEGILAVLVVGSIVIAIRASIITVISMLTVIALVNGLLYLIGYSLNTITLFGLILGLSLIVDDTIIMIEAIDAQRRKRRNPKEVISVATRKVGQAMIAATSTAALSFAPLLFVGGIIGGFVRAIPITIISALAISLIVALVFIPLFARLILLRPGQLGEKNVHEPAAGIEAAIARFISSPMLWARNSKKKLFAVGLTAVIIGFGFVGAGGAIFQKVKFSIFPVDKDSNQLSVTLSFPAGTTLEQAEEITDRADKIVANSLGNNFVKAAYFGQANVQSAILNVDIIDYNKRDIKAPQLVELLNNKLENFEGAKAEAAQLGIGPTGALFTTQIDASKNRDGAIKLAEDVQAFLQTAEIKRPDGSVAKFKSTTGPDKTIYLREGDSSYVTAQGQFEDDDTSALVTLAQTAVEKEFPKDRVAGYGLDKDALSFNFGMEDENQESFATLAMAFPALLAVIYILLAIQFRSLLQPLLIFLAIPFSFFGIAAGLYITNNPFSFFAMLGFFALIGLSIKNTILLTDFANQARRSGKDAIDAAHDALEERFRPLIATSLTAIVSLIPLAITSPFWEGLAVTLIFGLLSSTFLVITVFPYYYLGAEYLRSRVNRRTGLTWIALTALIIGALIQLKLASVAIIAPIASAIAIVVYKRLRRNK